MTDDHETPPPRRKRRAARIILWISACLVLLLAVVLFSARIYLSDARLTEMVPKLLSDELTGDFKIGSIDWEFPRRVIVRDAVVLDPRGVEVINAKYLDASIVLLPLLHGEISITDVVAKDVDIKPMTIADAFMPAVPSAEPSTSEPPAVRISAKSVENISVSFDEEDFALAATKIDVGGGSFLFSADEMEASGSLKIGEVKLRIKEPGPDEIADFGPVSIQLESAKFRQLFNGDEMQFEVGGAVISGLSSTIEVSGEIRGLPNDPNGEAEGTISLSFDDPQLVALIPEVVRKELEPKGKLKLDFQAKGSKADGEANIELTGDELVVAGTVVRGLVGHAKMEDDQLLIEQLYLALEEGRVDVRGKVGLTAKLPHELEVHANRIPVRKIVSRWADPEVLPAIATATASLSGDSLIEPSSRVVFQANTSGVPRALTAGLFTEGFARGTAEVRADHAILEPVFVSSNGASATVRGKVPFDTEHAMAVRLEAKDTRAAAHLERLGVPLSAKTVTLNAKVGGTYLSPEVEGEVVATEVTGPNIPPAEVRAPVKLSGGIVSVDGAVVELAGGQANIIATARVLTESGEPVTEPMIDGTVTLSAVDIGPFAEDRVEGRVSGTASFRGAPSDYVARAELDVGVIQAVGTTVAVSRIVIEGDETTLVLSPLRITPEDGGVIILGGSLNTQAETFSAFVRGQEIPAELIGAVSPEAPGFSGTIALSARAEGPLLKPVITGTASASNLAIDDIEIGNLQADVSTELETIQAKVSIAGDAGTLEAEGSLKLSDLAVDAKVRAVDLDVRKLPVLNARELGLDGKAGVDLYVKGNLPLPRVNGTIGIRGLMLDDHPVGNGRVELAVKTDAGGRYQLEGQALGALVIKSSLVPVENPPEGYLPISGEATVDIKALQLADVLPSVASNGLSVVASGRAELQVGKSAAPVTGKLSLNQLDAQFGTESISAPQEIVVRWDGKELILDPMTLVGNTGKFEAAGKFGETIDLRADGTIELAFVEPFVPQIARASGRAQISARIKGTAEDPRIEGSVVLLTPASIRPRGGLREISVEAAKITLVPGKATIEKLEGGMSGGRFSLSGDLGLNGFTPSSWNIRFEGSNLPYRNPEVLVEVDASLRVMGQGEVPRITGNLEIVRGRYLKKFRLEQFVFVQRTSAADDDDLEEDEPSPFLTDLELNIHARSVGEISVKVDAQAFAAEMDLTADIFIRGTAANPRIEGQVLSESGTLSFPATDLEVERAEISFQPTLSQGIRPVIDLLASGEVNANPSGAEGRPTPFDVSVRIEGPVEAMKLELTSQPALPQDQVLSLVVLGQVDPTMLVEGSETKGSGTIESSLVFAGSQLATPVTRFVEKQLEKQLNLQLQIGTEVSAERFRLTASRELTSRFRIEGGYERLFAESAGLTTGRALLFLSNSVFVEGMAQNTTLGRNSASTLEEGLSSSLELKLRLIGD
jgi:hypothetical protein